jgi:hypothetical protein
MAVVPPIAEIVAIGIGNVVVPSFEPQFKRIAKQFENLLSGVEQTHRSLRAARAREETAIHIDQRATEPRTWFCRQPADLLSGEMRDWLLLRAKQHKRLILRV